MIQKFQLKLVCEKTFKYNKKIDSSEKAVSIIDEVYDLKSQTEEVLVMIALDTLGTVIGCFEVSRGTNRFSILSYSEIFKRLLLSNATGFIIAHNHPSGNTKPSYQDIVATNELYQLSQIFNFMLLDSLIIGFDDYYSMAKQGDILFDKSK